jgi:PAS domain S-box-containing protein
VSVAEALIDALTPGCGLGLAVHDEDLRMLVISPSLAELSGTPAEAQLGRRLTEALPGEVGEVAEASLRVVAATREPLLQLEPAIEQGRERGWLISVYPLDHGGRELIAVVALDVTESRRAQQRLQESRERLAAAQEMAGVGSWTWDVAADEWTWSSELFRLIGVPETDRPPDFADVIGAVDPFSREDVRRITAQALRDGQPYELSFPVMLPGGRRRILRGRGVPQRDEDGRVVRIDGFAQDVTELTRAATRQTAVALLGRMALSGVPIDILVRQALHTVVTELELDAATAGELEQALQGGALIDSVVEPAEDDVAFMESVATIVASATVRLAAEQEVEGHSAARGRLVAQTLDAEDRARRGISEALHDGPLQDLLALGHDVSRLRAVGEGDEYHLERVRAGIARAVRQIREVMLDLHPVLLQVGGLESALHAICAQGARMAGYRCEVEIDPEAAGLRDELVLSLARELLRNVAKHADARHVRVTVRRTPGAVELEVVDDGVGIEPGRLRTALGKGHIGVASIHERAEAIGGSMRVAARPDGERGTQALAVLPV